VPRFTASLTGGPRCELGLLAGMKQGHAAGPWTARDDRGRTLEAVGEVTLDDGAGGERLLADFARDGMAAFERARGMFAIAIWDGETLTLARDAVGARTLFYARDADGWAAASTLRAFRRRPGLETRLDRAGVRDFLTFAYLPGERTLLEGVSEVLPGCAVRLGADGAFERVNYWEPREADEDEDARPGRSARRWRHLLEEATAARLPRGEEVGVFLSGGLDSSVVTALAARLHDRTVRTYAINFGSDLPNELAYSGLVAAHCRTRHRVLTFTGEQVAEHLPEAIAELDCLVGDPLTVPNLLLARAAAGDGLRVVLNGEGGDPVFGGPKNLPMVMWELLREDADPLARARAYLVSYRKCYEDLPALLTPEAHRALAGAPAAEETVRPYLESPRMRAYLNRLLYTNVRTKGAHHILTKVERLTSSCGLEGRAPLFDRDVVDFAFAVPAEYKLAGTSEKWILKLAAAGLLPRTVVHRPKSGMRVPVQHWLRGPLAALAEDLLVGPRARARGLFRTEPIRAWMNGQGSLWPRHGGKLWLLLSLELWMRSFLDGE
jgi:asparagine synthase (glutamine-hydrolysing)